MTHPIVTAARVALLLSLAPAATARAGGPVVVLSPGAILAARAGSSTGPTLGLGAELTLVCFPWGLDLSGKAATRSDVGVGALFQAEWLAGNPRITVGAEATVGFFGLEVATFAISATPTAAPVVGVHVAPFASVGFASAALTLDVPLARTGPGRWPNPTIGLLLTVKIPLPLSRQTG